MEEAALKIILMIDFFQKFKKRLPENFREVKDFIGGLGYPVDIAEFHELFLEALSPKKLKVEYSLNVGEDRWTSRRKVEMTCFRDELTQQDRVLSKLRLDPFEPEKEEAYFS